MNLAKFPRHPLTFGPTPIEKLERLGAHLGGDIELYAKREDCNSGLAFGGNKLRKLEYIVPDAIASYPIPTVAISGWVNTLAATVFRRSGATASPSACHIAMRPCMPATEASSSTPVQSPAA